MAVVTGEAAPVLVGPGDPVIAGTLLIDGAITVVVEATGSATVVHRMAAELLAAQDRAMEPSATDRMAPWLTLATLVAATATFLGWWIAAGTGVALAPTVAVLVVACPCALALAQPLAAAAGLGAAARRGLLLRSPERLVALAAIRVAAFDKTGTVTGGAVTVTEAGDAVLRIAAGLERYSTHPIAWAITGEAARRGIPLPSATGVVERPGRGMEGMVDGSSWRLEADGPGCIAVRSIDGLGSFTSGTIRLGDSIRPDAAATITALRALGVHPTLLTGDHPEVAATIGLAAGIDGVEAAMPPSAKATWIRARQAEGTPVLFAGDGLNDGPALAAADVGIAMATGAASSILVADGIISSGSLAPVVAGIRAGRAALRIIRRSQWQSIAYNVVSVAAAVAGLVTPLVAAVLMPISSALVIWNAGRVERLVQREEACADS
jgi:cation transport ATPase